MMAFHRISNILFTFLFYSFISFSSGIAQESFRQGCSEATIERGEVCYPPSHAFMEVLQRSAYLVQPQTQRYLQKSPALMFHLLSPYYTVQRNGTSCSLASATMVLNAVRELRLQRPLEKAASQNEVLEKVNDPLWLEATKDEGPGVTLEQYAVFLNKMFTAYGVGGVSVECLYVENRSEALLQQIHGDLMAVGDDKQVTTFLLLDFDDATFIQVPTTFGHISPIGAYDAENHLVLILDVDREWTGPYWITEKTLIDGLNTLDGTEGLTKPTYRGYIRIRV